MQGVRAEVAPIREQSDGTAKQVEDLGTKVNSLAGQAGEFKVGLFNNLQTQFQGQQVIVNELQGQKITIDQPKATMQGQNTAIDQMKTAVDKVWSNKTKAKAN